MRSAVRHFVVGSIAATAAVLASVLAGPLFSLAQSVPPGPVVTHIAPNNGPARGGSPVAIAGRGFSGRVRVYFGSTRAAAIRRRSSTSIEVSSPAGSGVADVHVLASGGRSQPSPYDRFAYDPSPSGRWLGLNDNSASYLGPVGRFAANDVAYARDEYRAGVRPGGADWLHMAIVHHMIPDVVIEYAGYTGRDFGQLDPSFPQGEGIGQYVAGFLQTAKAILRAYPGRRILFEPINEPYGHATPAQYAAVVAQLLPAARGAGIPLDSIYVAAYGNGWVPAMYAAQPQLRTLVQGWYFHPYGPPAGAANGYSEGIQSLSHVQAEMTSGQSNIVVSEIGWCAVDVNHGAACGKPRVGSARQAARLLTESLDHALPMRREGWLRALLVYSRNDGGWAMETPPGILTEQGKALIRFARSHPSR